MNHTITEEHLCTISFDKILASEVDSRKGEAKYLKMYIIVDHLETFIKHEYKVIYKNFEKREEGEPITQDWNFTLIDLAMDKYNSI